MKYCKVNKTTASLTIALLVAITFIFITCKDPLDTGDDPVVENTIDYSISGAVTPGSTSHDFSGSFAITNNGNTPGTETVTWKVFISENNSYDAGDTLLDQGTVAALAPGATSSTINYSGTYPMVSGSNDYYFIIQVSAADETLNTNNTSVSSPVTFNILFYESFENAYNNSWTINDTFYTLSFDLLSGLTGGTPADGSTYALQQTNATVNTTPTLWDNSQKYFFSSDISPSYVRFYVRAGQTDKSGGYFVLLGPDPWPAKINILFREIAYFESTGSLILNQGMYTTDTWYKIEIKDIDYAANTYDVYINGDLDFENKVVTSGISAFGGITLYNWDDGQFFYDDILIY